MKKYVKPDVAFEGFDLSQHIAGGCTAMMNFDTIETCETDGSGEFTILPGFFNTSNNECTGIWASDEDYCLYANTGSVVFFKS